MVWVWVGDGVKYSRITGTYTIVGGALDTCNYSFSREVRMFSEGYLGNASSPNNVITYVHVL